MLKEMSEKKGLLKREHYPVDTKPARDHFWPTAILVGISGARGRQAG